MICLNNCRSTFVITLGNFVQSWTVAGSKIPQNIFLMPSSSKWNLFLICMHKETSKFKQSVLILVSPVSSVGITDNKIIYVTPQWSYMKPIEYALLHPICILSHLMCACKHCNIKLSPYYWTHWSCWWIYHFKKHRFSRDFWQLNIDT